MNIAVDIRELQSEQLTGTARFLQVFLDNVDEGRRKDIYLLGDTATDTSRYKDVYPIAIYDAPPPLWYDQFTIPRALKKYKIDVFFSPYFKMPFFTKCKRVITIHDLHFLKHILRTGVRRFKPYVTYLKYAVRQADKIITVSHFSKREILAQLPVEEEKLYVVYNGVDERFAPVDKEKRKLLNFRYNLDQRYILYIGNMKPHKNIKCLLMAYSTLSARLKSVYKLVIISKKDDHFREIAKFISDESLEEEVLILDFVPTEDLSFFYNFAHVFVFPSLYEGFGLPPLEAMASGAPVIASRIEPLKEVLGDSALYFDPQKPQELKERLIDMLENETVREEYLKKGARQVEKYSAKSASAQLLREIESAA